MDTLALAFHNLAFAEQQLKLAQDALQSAHQQICKGSEHACAALVVLDLLKPTADLAVAVTRARLCVEQDAAGV